MMTRRARWPVLLWLATMAVPSHSAGPDGDIVVHVRHEGAEIVVEVDCPVQAPLPVVWEVLTDYDNMSRFISNIHSSTVRSRVDNMLTVRQTGQSTHGPFTFAFDSLREVTLRPYSELHSRLISGNFRASTSTTRIVRADGLLHIVNNGRHTPTLWVPPLIGPALIEAETRKQFGEVRTEILRRAKLGTAALALP